MESGNGKRGRDKLTVKKVEAWLRDLRRDTAVGIKRVGGAGDRLSDGGSLYLTALASGNATWQVRYLHGGKPRTFSIGLSDEKTLADARSERDEIRDLIKKGLDPVTTRRAQRMEKEGQSESTFADVASSWLEKQKPDWSDVHYTKSERALNRDVIPYIGKLPVAQITTVMVASVIERI